MITIKRDAQYMVLRLLQALLKTYPKFVTITDHLLRQSVQIREIQPLTRDDLKKESMLIKHRCIESVETKPKDENVIIQKIIESYKAAKKQQATVSHAYQPTGGWETFFEHSWKNLHSYIVNSEYDNIAHCLRNFFRNEAISGLWSSDTNAFFNFKNLDKLAQLQRLHLIQNHYRVWRSNLPTVDVRELEAPPIGNPWGYCLNTFIIYEPVFEYNYHAHYFTTLVSTITTPTILEIGGGFGGLAYHLLRCRPSIKYIGFDLPENLLLQTYYLSCLFPHAKLLTYHEEMPPLDKQQLDTYDIILLPNFELKRTESSLADLIINIRSLSEMSHETIKEYFAQIDRIGKLFFYHENIYKKRKDNLFGIPSTSFPMLNKYLLLSAHESRWPKYNAQSPYPCQENLFIRKDMVHTYEKSQETKQD